MYTIKVPYVLFIQQDDLVKEWWTKVCLYILLSILHKATC